MKVKDKAPRLTTFSTPHSFRYLLLQTDKYKAKLSSARLLGSILKWCDMSKWNKLRLCTNLVAYMSYLHVESQLSRPQKCLLDGLRNQNNLSLIVLTVIQLNIFLPKLLSLPLLEWNFHRKLGPSTSQGKSQKHETTFIRILVWGTLRTIIQFF